MCDFKRTPFWANWNSSWKTWPSGLVPGSLEQHTLIGCLPKALQIKPSQRAASCSVCLVRSQPVLSLWRQGTDLLPSLLQVRLLCASRSTRVTDAETQPCGAGTPPALALSSASLRLLPSLQDEVRDPGDHLIH